MAKKAKEQKNDVKKMNEESQKKVFTIAVIIILAAIACYFIFKPAPTDFWYNKIYFEKVPMGDLMFYTAEVPIIDSTGKIVYTKEFDFRSDPRKLEYINVTNFESARFIKNDVVYVSTRSDIKTCKGDTGIALVNNGVFLKALGFDVKGAFDDANYSNSTTTPYVNCENHKDNTVIMIKEGNETAITMTGPDCYEITFKNCEVIEATEKFKLAIFENYMANFQTS